MHSFLRVMEYRGFKKGWESVPAERIPELCSRLMAATGFRAIESLHALRRGVRPADANERGEIEMEFKRFGVEDVWDK